MSRFVIVVVAVVLLSLAASATVHTITANGTSFTPQFITIALGDTVRWTNTGGTHNVVHAGNPVLFTSGQPAAPNSPTWPYSFSGFPSAGFYDYFCQPHAGFGMAGMITVEQLDAPEVNGPVATELALLQNYPNPFNPETQISFNLPTTSHANLTVFNVLGEQVRTLVDGTLSSGEHVVAFNGSGLGAGIYFYRLETPQGALSRKMVLVK